MIIQEGTMHHFHTDSGTVLFYILDKDNYVKNPSLDQCKRYVEHELVSFTDKDYRLVWSEPRDQYILMRIDMEHIGKLFDVTGLDLASAKQINYISPRNIKIVWEGGSSMSLKSKGILNIMP